HLRLTLRPPPPPTPFPYTTLFRSKRELLHQLRARRERAGRDERRGPEDRVAVLGDSRELAGALRGAVAGRHQGRARQELLRGLLDRKSTRLKLQSRSDLVCRLLLE